MPAPPRSLPRLRSLLSVPAPALVVALALAACGSSGNPSPGPSAGASRSVPLLSIFEADPQLRANPVGTLDTFRRLGVDYVRVFMPWGTLGSLQGVAPDSAARRPPRGFNGADPAAYPAGNWAIFDTIVRAATARGIGVDLTLGPPPPLWAQGPGDPGHPVHPQWRPSARLYGEFVRAVGIRYSGRYTPPGGSSPLPHVKMWALWNEPNFGPMLAPQTIDHSQVPVSPALYRPLLDAGYAALGRSGHASDTILIGELAPRGIDVGSGPGEFRYMVPLAFLRDLYCVNGSLQPLGGPRAAELNCPTGAGSRARFVREHPGLFHAGGFALHPYEFGPPTFATPGEPDFADLATLPHVEQVLDRILALYGVNRKYPIYNTEFGYETDPPETVAGTVSPAQAAVYLNESEYLSWRDPRMRTYDQYLLQDPASGLFATGLEFANGTPKPGLAAYRLPIWMPRSSGSPGTALEIWGCVRAADVAASQTGRRQRVVVEFRRGAAGAFKPLLTVPISSPAGYVDIRTKLPASGAVRLAWKPPAGAVQRSRIVTVTIK